MYESPSDVEQGYIYTPYRYPRKHKEKKTFFKYGPIITMTPKCLVLDIGKFKESCVLKKIT